ncbi:MAG: hypothetical protein DBY13_02130 [Lachnospiraceae bacterium]|nr:MAG: hypothetical protein DBY13_02130 [Lachnospiraceae bacterium]HCI25296.1 hypothetical protein [Lachnospiraceae bacterium]
MQESVTINRSYKDRLFKIIFEDKKELLSLYNALTGKNYQNPDELEINTIDDVIYMHLKNDMSFILDDWQNLFEQQSTFNPNQPLRGFFYFADLYKVKYFGKKIYSTRLLKIPTPQYIVFYNGTTNMPDKKELRLSDAFQQPTTQPDIEVVAHMLNINYGHNKELMERCRKLKEYAQFIDIIRHYLKENEHWSNEQAISKAIDDCIKNNILRDILQKERLRVMASILSEFDEVGYKEMIQDEAIEDGEIRGSIKLAYKLKLPKPEIIAILRHDYNLSDEEVNQYMQKFWKN